MRVTKIILLFFFISLTTTEVNAKIKALTTIPDLAWALKAVGADHIEVESLLSANEDPHFAMTLPSFIFKARDVDLLCYVGLELEIGWLPKIVEKSANQRIAKGSPGDCDTSKAISPLETHSHGVDRSMGDVHAAGNPHYTLSPIRMKEILIYYQRKLSELDPANQSIFAENAKKAINEIDHLVSSIKQKLSTRKNLVLMEYHKEYTYFISDFKLHSEGSIESIPGVPPSAGELLEVSKKIKNHNVSLILAGPTANIKVLNKLKDQASTNFLIHSALMKEESYLDHIQTLSDEILALSGGLP